MSRRSKRRSQPTVALQTNQPKNRVDRWLNQAKDHPLVAVVCFLALLVFAVAKLTDSTKAITDAWSRLRPAPPKLLVEPMVEWQPGFDIDNRIRSVDAKNPLLKALPELDISWVALLALTNLTDRSIVITEFDPAFLPADKVQAFLFVHRVGLDAYVADTENAFHDGTGALDFRAGSIALPPGAKRYIAFRTFLGIAQHNHDTELTDVDQAKRLILMAIGGDIEEHGYCRVVVGPFGGVFKFVDGSSFTFTSRTALFVPGCYATVPFIQK